ncbi:IclR family transcriptional regulator [Nocardia sp. BMG111209]|uniref:IclR family transcriptional regulator n=1 Tax=Nocardia sp. BMG111209 TaxID=1160137 RepID=UPI0003691A9B|nr:IclR family transcriptional regulator [Nocardia sp. BMG111209]
MARSTSGESVLERVVRIFEAFDTETPAITVTELARRAGLPPATASRLVGELVGYGWLRRDADRRVRIGVRMWELAVRASPTLGLREAAMPYMEDLHAVVGHHVQLGVLHHREVLYVDRLSAPGAVRNVSRFGGRMPLHATSPGLVLLAYGPVELQESILSGPLRAFTERTPGDSRTLRTLLGEIRRTGYAYCDGFIDDLSTAVAAPLRGRGDHVVAALSVIVPRDGSARSILPALLAAARGISRTLQSPGFAATG